MDGFKLDKNALSCEERNNIILGFKSLDSIMTDAMITSWAYDYDVMKKWGIKQSQIQSDAEILHAPRNIMKENRMIFGVVISLFAAAVVIIWLLNSFYRKQKKQNDLFIDTEKTLHTTEELMQKEEEIQKVKRQQERIMAMAPQAFFLVVGGVIQLTNSYSEKNSVWEKAIWCQGFFQTSAIKWNFLIVFVKLAA